MTDSEITTICEVVKQILAERDTAARTEAASLRQDLRALQAKVHAQREADAESQQRTMKLFADAISDAVSPTLKQLQQRTAELERRAIV